MTFIYINLLININYFNGICFDTHNIYLDLEQSADAHISNTKTQIQRDNNRAVLSHSIFIRN